MNELQIFNNPEFGDVRTVEVNGEPWLVGKDVAIALGYTNPQKAIRDHVDDEDKTVNETFSVNGTPLVLINESGLYSLVLSSKLPSAKKFKRWVTSEVLPALRKNGAYTDQRQLSPAEMFLAQAQLNVDMERRVQAVERKVSEAVNIFAVPAVSKDHWQTEMNAAINRLCEGYGLSHQKTRGDMYAELEETVGCNLTARQSRLKERMKRGGATYKETQAVTKLAVIAQDAKLRAAFEGIVRRWTAQKLA